MTGPDRITSAWCCSPQHPFRGQPRTPVMTIHTRTALRAVLGAAAVGAGVIHLAFAPEHLREFLPLGIGFIAAGVLQILWGVGIVVRESRWLLRVGGLLSLAFIAVYLVSRSVGLPFGPEAFEPEPFAVADLLCCALEIPVVIGALLLSSRPRALWRPLRLSMAVLAITSLGFIGTASAYAASAPAHEHGQQEHTACPAAPVLTGHLNGRGVDTGVTSYFACKFEHEHDGHH